MIDLGVDEVDGAILEALDKVLSGASNPGWSTDDKGQTTLDRNLWGHLTGLTVAEPGEEAPALLTYALVAEKLGEALVGLPLIDHLVAVRLLDALGGEQAQELRRRDGVLGLLIPAEQTRQSQPPLSLGGAIADQVLRLGNNGSIELLSGPAPLIPNLGELPVGRIDDEAATLGSGRADLVRTATLERKVLYSAALAGMSRKAIALAVDYANERELFGAPIGAFQALAHSLSTAKVHADGAELLAREAAWSRDAEPEHFERHARMTYAFAASAGDIATRTAVHVFGGYGVTREYPAQAYFRTARSLTLLAGDRRLDLRAVGQELLKTAAEAAPAFSTSGAA